MGYCIKSYNSCILILDFIRKVIFFMPIIWRYLLIEYFKVLFLSLIAFIAILLTTRLDEIAHFATLGSETRYIVLFILYQIPYILPIAIPISCLISTIILIQRLSLTQEITALRACGLSVRAILTPILLAAALIATLNFYIVSELATSAHLQTGLIKSELRSVNPLLLLHNKRLLRMKGGYFDILGSSRIGETASDIILAMPNKNNTRINVMFAKNLTASPSSLIGNGVTLISSLHEDHTGNYDQVMIENMETTKTAVKDFSQILEKRVWTINNDHLRLPLLRLRLKDERTALETAKKASLPLSEIKQIQRKINRIYSEIVRRFSLSFAVLTFTFMGAAFGISISRHRSNLGTILVIILACTYLIAYFFAKSADHLPAATSILYLMPHVIIVLLAIWFLRRTSRGIE